MLRHLRDSFANGVLNGFGFVVGKKSERNLHAPILCDYKPNVPLPHSVQNATLCAMPETALAPYSMSKTPVGIDDGRSLLYYDFAPHGSAPEYLALHREAACQSPPQGARTLPHPSEMRWDPTRAEWVIYAAHRMSRPMLPSADACPLCPGIVEIPLPYQVALFENRAPALCNAHEASTLLAEPPAGDFDFTQVARGHCDMVVYSQQHDAKLPQMPVNEISCLVEAWRDRYAELMKLPSVQFAAILENKGRDAGMTLDHPHGQIYAMPFLPPIQQAQWQQTQANKDLWNRIIEKELKDKQRIIAETAGFLAAQPFYARFPYEVHIWAKRDGVCSLIEMTPHERRELAGVLKNITQRYENLWPNSKYGFPTVMLMHQFSRAQDGGFEGAEAFRFHIEFYPLQRSPDKLKYRASIETGTHTFLNDALPETQASELQSVAPQQVELPTILFS
jgi:UDPglucose--hexose-1-phosphate uridylyltransferase